MRNAHRSSASSHNQAPSHQAVVSPDSMPSAARRSNSTLRTIVMMDLGAGQISSANQNLDVVQNADRLQRPQATLAARVLGSVQVRRSVARQTKSDSQSWWTRNRGKITGGRGRGTSIARRPPGPVGIMPSCLLVEEKCLVAVDLQAGVPRDDGGQ